MAAQHKRTRSGAFSIVPPDEILPVLAGDYESSVKGIYVIGDLTGLPLVKIAANHGVDLFEGLDRRGAFAEGPAREDCLDVVIVGAGPAGLSAAVEAEKRGLEYVVLERAVVASTVHAFPPGKHVYSEPRFLKNRSRLPTEGDPIKGDFLEAVDRLVSEYGLNVREGTEVVRLGKVAEREFLVETESGESFTAARVILALGRRGQPRKLGVPGEELSHKVTYRLHTPDDYRDRDILVVGGGNSAVEAALMLADTNRVTLSYRRGEFFRLKRNNLEAILEAIAGGRIDVLFGSRVREIHEEHVDLDVGGEARSVPNDCVLILTGSLPPIEFLMETGLELDGVWNAKRVVASLVGILMGCLVYFRAKDFALLPEKAGETVAYIPGFSWLFKVVPPFFANLYGFYYLLYFVGILVFGLYWAFRYGNRIVWRRNLLLILFNWTVWWGLPTFLVVRYGRNVWSPLLLKALNAWPLNLSAFDLSPVIRAGDPAWWHTAAIGGVVWAVFLTFVLLPLFTVLVGKHYCSHLCSCGALAETVGNSFRHRGPKADWARRAERFGFVFLALGAVATVTGVLGHDLPVRLYNTWVGTLLAGALAVGLYPFLGQRIWCRYWCPLAFWMNFWGRWSRFRISPEPGKCIDCGVCNRHCQMGIDIRSRALKGVPVTLRDTPCVACGECIVRCPMEILHFGEVPPEKAYPEGTDAGPRRTVAMKVHDTIDIPGINELSTLDRVHGEKT